MPADGSSERPPVDVLMCVRDRAETVEAAVESVRVAARFAQRSVAITVVDGGSTDGTRELVGAMAGVRVVDQLGIGLAAARNEALAMTDAPLVAWLDADDRWTEHSLAVRLAAHDGSDHVNRPDGHELPALVVGRMSYRRLGPVPDARYQDRWDRVVRGLTPGAVLVTRTAFETVGGLDTRLSVGADSDWFARAARAGEGGELRIVDVDDVVLEKGIGADNASHDVVRYRRELFEVVRRHGRSADAAPGPLPCTP